MKLTSEQERLITSLVISYYNSGVEFDHMKDRQESLKFFKLAHDLSLKELGPNSYLTNTLSERIAKTPSDGAASTNPSEKDTKLNIMKSDKILKENFKSHKKRKMINLKKKQLHLNRLMSKNFNSLIKYPNSQDNGLRSVSQVSNKCDSHRTNMSKYLRNSKNYSNCTFLNSDESRKLR